MLDVLVERRFQELGNAAFEVEGRIDGEVEILVLVFEADLVEVLVFGCHILVLFIVELSLKFVIEPIQNSVRQSLHNGRQVYLRVVEKYESYCRCI